MTTLKTKPEGDCSSQTKAAAVFMVDLTRPVFVIFVYTSFRNVYSLKYSGSSLTLLVLRFYYAIPLFKLRSFLIHLSVT